MKGGSGPPVGSVPFWDVEQLTRLELMVVPLHGVGFDGSVVEFVEFNVINSNLNISILLT